VAETLGRWPAVFTDSQGRVTGFWGLAISELSPEHRYVTGGRVLYAWCAWDTLFLPARLAQAARVTSACPVTGELITLTVTPEGVTETSHPEAVVSFLEPGGPFDAGVIESFCHFVHFFANRQAGEQWAAGHPAPSCSRSAKRPTSRHAATNGCSRTSWSHADGQDSYAARTPEASSRPNPQ
jgi:alkylmercury lyase